MIDIIQKIFMILAIGVTKVLSLTADPDTGMTIGDLAMGAIFVIIFFMVVIGLGKRSSGIGGD